MDTAVIEMKELYKRGSLRTSNELSPNGNWQRQRSHYVIRGSNYVELDFRQGEIRFTCQTTTRCFAFKAWY